MKRFTRAGSALAGIGALVVAGCGSKVIDSGKAEKFVKSGLEAGGTTKVKSVSCPSNVEVKSGRTFDCKVQGQNGQKLKVKLRIVDSKGTVTPVGAAPG